MRSLHRRRALGPLALALAVSALAGCGSHDRPGESPQRTLAAAKENLDATKGVHIGLSTPKLPTGVSGLLDADGIGTHAPAFSGAIKVSSSGITADASVVAVEHTVYAKLPFTSKFVRIDPADYGAPDPASLMAARGGLSSLLTSATQVKDSGKVRAGSAVLTSYTATVPGKAVSAVIPSATSTAGFRATFTVDDSHRLAKAVLTGPFYPHAKDVTYTITFDKYGTTKRIVAP
ncbi:MAG: lipoprotein LprG [Nocardioidaceae bacterium]|jgi:lipoprotein LprG|nr:lipoprotein LprG [Nocardioidaceae bacterium]